MPERDEALLPDVAELRSLSDDQTRAIVMACDAEGKRNFLYDMTGLLGGIACFLSALGVFAFLVMHQHEASAGIALGATVAAMIGRMIRRRNG
jgi:hypothetical protein